MAVTQYAKVAKAIKLAMKGWSPLLERVNRLDEIDNPYGAGAITVPTITGLSAVTPVDGTNMTNQLTNSSVSLAFVDQIVPVKWTPSQNYSFMTDEYNLNQVVMNAKDTMIQAIQNAIITDLIAATPGVSETLTNGQLNFTTDGTDAEIRENLRKFYKLVGWLLSSNTDLVFDPTSVSGLAYYEAWSNLQALDGSGTGIVLDQRMNPVVKGVTVFPINVNTAFDGATEPCLYLFTKDAVTVAVGDASIVSDPTVVGGDGFHLLAVSMPFGHAVTRASGTAEILNGAS